MSDAAQDLDRLLREAAAGSGDRVEMVGRILAEAGVRRMAEVGVYRGRFAEAMLKALPGIETYILVDPWRHLEDWRKPANVEQDEHEQNLALVRKRTEPFGTRVRVLRGRTTEVVDQVRDGALDAVYLDGDHSLRGIAIDLECWYPKVRDGGLILGDDFALRPWNHGPGFEPTLVFPFAIYFAEARGDACYALGYNQFAIVKDEAARAFSFTDLDGRYGERELRPLMVHGAAPRKRKPESGLRRLVRRLAPRTGN